jgi:uncharacterized membrane protein
VIARWLPGLAHLQNVHPLVVHYPIALLSAAAALYVFAWIAGSEKLEWAALWMLVLGFLGAAAALASGLYAAPGVMVADSVRANLLRPHKQLMIAASALTTVLAVWAVVARPMPRRGRIVFVAALIALVALITKGADYGGRMVYDYNAGGNACSQPIDFTP